VGEKTWGQPPTLPRTAPVHSGVARMGPWFNSNLGPSLSLPPLPPSPPLPQLSPSPAAKRPPNPARGSGERCKLPSEVWGRAPAEIEFGAF